MSKIDGKKSCGIRRYEKERLKHCRVVFVSTCSSGWCCDAWHSARRDRAIQTGATLFVIGCVGKSRQARLECFLGRLTGRCEKWCRGKPGFGAEELKSRRRASVVGVKTRRTVPVAPQFEIVRNSARSNANLKKGKVRVRTSQKSTRDHAIPWYGLVGVLQVVSMVRTKGTTAPRSEIPLAYRRCFFCLRSSQRRATGIRILLRTTQK
jgi:hypothetical protein